MGATEWLRRKARQKVRKSATTIPTNSKLDGNATAIVSAKGA